MQVIMRFLTVAHGIFPVGDVYGLVGHHLDVLPVEDAVCLLGNHVGDPRLPGVEVIAEFLHGVGLAFFFHGGLAGDCPRRVFRAPCKYSLCLQVIFHVVRRQFHVSIGDSDITIIIYHPLAFREVLHYGVPCGGECRHVKGTLVQKGYGVRPCNRIRTGGRVHCSTHGIRYRNSICSPLSPFDPDSLAVAPVSPVLLRRHGKRTYEQQQECRHNKSVPCCLMPSLSIILRHQ